jgi:hypothetical protein
MESRLVSKFQWCTAKYGSDWDSAPLLPENVCDSLAQYTTVDIAPKSIEVPLSSDDILEFPLVYLTGHIPFTWSPSEERNLRRIVDRGGMIFMDDHNHDIDGKFHKSAVENITRVFGKYKEVPKDHDIYNSFFKFQDGAPDTEHELNGWGDQLVHPCLFAVFDGAQPNNKIGGPQDRIQLLYSNKDYSSWWNFHPERKKFDPIDVCRFGVNLIVYALTR